VTLETYGTRYTRPDSQTPHSGAAQKDIRENLTQDTDRERYHPSRKRPPSCGDAEVQEGGIALSKYPTGTQTGECDRDVDDSPN